MAKEAPPNGTQAETRTEEFSCVGPADLDVRIRTGRLEVRATGTEGIRVQVAVESSEERGWERRLEGVLSGVSAGGYDPADVAVHALRETRITFSEERRRLVITTPRSFRRIALAVTVEVPARSRVKAALERGSAAVSGQLCELHAVTGSGDLDADQIDGDAQVATASGRVRLGTVGGRLRVRSGSGGIDVTALEGTEAKLTTGTGDVWLGAVRSDVRARTGSGNVIVAEAASGRLDLVTGSGDVNVSVRPGVAAEIDLGSGSGQARSDLEVATSPPSDAPHLRIRARTGSGDAIVASMTG